jgi:hypothetical protein
MITLYDTSAAHEVTVPHPHPHPHSDGVTYIIWNTQ